MNGNVELGDFEFNPVEEQDFRLSVEGASKTGKSNTLAVIREGGSIDYEDIQDALGHSTKGHVNKPVNALEAHGLITKEKKDGVTHVDLNVDGIQEIRKKARKREETEDLMEDLGL